MASSKTVKANLERTAVLLAFGFLLYKAGAEFYAIADGTGNWYANFSRTWYLLFWVFAIACLALLIFCAATLWFPETVKKYFHPLLILRERSRFFRWIAAILLLILPLYFFEFNVWSVVFSGIYIRFLILTLCLLAFAVLFTRSDDSVLTWKPLLASALIYSFVFTVAAQFTDVVMYPFSNGWSEGNRLWDYSIIFGRARYIYPADQPLVPYLDIGRQLTGGFGFLWPNLNIAGARFWVDFVGVFPYIILGWLTFSSLERSETKSKGIATVALVAWTFLFLRQGPIHPPLVFSALLLAFAWRRPLKIALPVIILAAYFAAISRFTWTFAIPIWAVMLEFALPREVNKQTWTRSIAMGIAGLFGGALLPKIIGLILGQPQGISVSTVTSATSQPLLWYRLLPNATYDKGVIFGMLIATLPLIILLAYLLISRRWVLQPLQKLGLGLPLLAFLVVGLIVSAKAGGGGDLHNMDMFLIGLMFTGAVAWFNGGSQWVQNEAPPFLICVVMIFMIVYPMTDFIQWLRPVYYRGDTAWLVTLTGAANSRSLGFMPSDNLVNEGLGIIRNEMNSAKGEVLFMDQRQLLTFGYIKDVPLVADYDKKLVMDKAISQDVKYFAPFYADLARHRFALIISDPLRVPTQTSGNEFGEENNVWVKWVSAPILCYYEPIETYPELRLMLLVPRAGMQDCSSVLPPEVHP